MEVYFKITIGILYVCLGYLRFIYRKPYRTIKNNILYRKHAKREKVLVVLVGWGLWLPCAIYATTPWLNDFVLPFGWPLRSIGIVTAFLGLVLFQQAHKALGINWSPMLEIREKHQLITQGVYKHIRHPLYAALYLFIIGIGIAAANYVVLVVPFFTFSIMCYLRIADEEKMMTSWFGNEYLLYKYKTGMFIPHWFWGRKRL